MTYEWKRDGVDLPMPDDVDLGFLQKLAWLDDTLHAKIIADGVHVDTQCVRCRMTREVNQDLFSRPTHIRRHANMGELPWIAHAQMCAWCGQSYRVGETLLYCSVGCRTAEEDHDEMSIAVAAVGQCDRRRLENH